MCWLMSSFWCNKTYIVNNIETCIIPWSKTFAQENKLSISMFNSFDRVKDSKFTRIKWWNSHSNYTIIKFETVEGILKILLSLTWIAITATIDSAANTLFSRPTLLHNIKFLYWFKLLTLRPFVLLLAKKLPFRPSFLDFRDFDCTHVPSVRSKRLPKLEDL